MTARLTRRCATLLCACLALAACAAPTPPPSPAPPPSPTFSPAESRPPATLPGEFTTDFTRHSVPYTELISGGPPKDGIPSIDAPQFVTPAEADAWLDPVEPVVLMELNGEARAYPLQILTWHELVNDTLGGVPVTVTFCPLCNTAAVFERIVAGQVLDFGSSGRLRYANLVMYDRQTESWWQQATGEAIVGELTGAQLNFFPAAIVSWQDFLDAHPHGLVLSRETGYNRDYGRNPYSGYDDFNQSPFLSYGWVASYRGPVISAALPPIARVLTVARDEDAVAYPYELLEEEQVVNDTVGGQDIVVFWAAGTASALDERLIADGRDVGAAAAYARALDDQPLTFQLLDGHLLDLETGSEWNVLGVAVAGPLAGRQLMPVVALNHFWFSWAAFRPETRIYAGAGP